MTIKTLFFVGVSGLRLPFRTGRGERFGGDFWITNDRSQIERLVGPYRDNIGSVEFRFLTKTCPNLVYSHGQAPDDGLLADDRLVSDVTIQSLLKVQQLLKGLWRVKDNAAFEDRGWTVALRGSGQKLIHGNHWNSRKSMADGNLSDVEFSRDELRLARAFVDDDKPIAVALSGHATGLTDTGGRILRFGYFIECARDTWDLAMKVVQQALFQPWKHSSSSHSEISHQVAERVACLVAEPGDARIEVFNKLKRGYALRSQAVHGAGFREKKFDIIRSTSVETDIICRKILQRIDTDESVSAAFDLSEEEMGVCFQRLVFGARAMNTTNRDGD